MIFKVLRNSNLAERNSYLNLQSKQNIECWVLGNGPSLMNDLIKYYDKIENCDVVVVNDFVKSDFYEKLKPKYYVIADPAFGRDSKNPELKERVDNFFIQLKKKTVWEVCFFVPQNISQNIIRKIENDYIKVFTYSTIPVERFGFFGKYFISNGYGMPYVQNVLVACLTIMVNLKYKTINILGADHSWLENIDVNDKLQVCIKDKHFFDNKGDVLLKPWYKNDDEVFKMSEILRTLAITFDSYHVVEAYARKMGAEIINRSSISLIDAFRKNIGS